MFFLQFTNPSGFLPFRQGCEPKVVNGSVGFSVFHQTSVGLGGRFEKNRKTNDTETEHLSVGFSAKPAKWSAFRRLRCAFVGIM